VNAPRCVAHRRREAARTRATVTALHPATRGLTDVRHAVESPTAGGPAAGFAHLVAQAGIG
jgi:hypothetical protein